MSPFGAADPRQTDRQTDASFLVAAKPVRRPCLVPPQVTGGLAMLLFVSAPREVLTKTWEPLRL